MASNSTARPLPGAEPLSRDFITQHQQARIIAALAAEASERGYHAVTVADVVKRAGIARNTFYENFSSKEECFLAAQRFANSKALERIVTAAGEVNDWPGRVRAGLAALLEYMAEEPALARTCVVESLAAGPAAVRCHEESLQSFVSLFKLGRGVSPYSENLPKTIDEAIVGGVFWIVYQRLALGQAGDLHNLLPEMLEFALTPYLGAETARALSVTPQTG
ncbi:MAG TPA: helix-turn-helix domain-containing protein [Solirubrobacterales bacterium]|nr:helix-turn-helix domain-containing protein [Solirubrobacterales bacterium]